MHIGLDAVARVTPALRTAPASVAGLAGFTRRGVPGRPVRITGVEQFTDRFGGHLPDGYLADAVTGFFVNGGRTAYVVRAASSGAVAAEVALPATGRPSLRITAGHRGEPDPGSWAAALRLDVQDDPKATTTVVRASGRTVRLASLTGIEVGSVLRLPAGPRRVTAVHPTTRTVTVTTAVGTIARGATVTTAEFRLIIRCRDDLTRDYPVVEDWRGLTTAPDTADYVVDRLNHPEIGSRYVMVSDVGDDPPAAGADLTLAGGTDGTPDADDLVTALSCLDKVQLVAVPDAHRFPADRARIMRRAIDYCTTRGDCFFVGSTPSTVELTEPLDAAYGALYAPWLTVAASAGVPVRAVPPDGHVLGVYARTEQESGVFRAPAGDTATIRGALAVTTPPSGDSTRVNEIRATKTGTPVITGSRTLSTDPRWREVGTRLLFNVVKATLRDGLRSVRHEPHSEELRRGVRLDMITPFLLDLWRRGAFGSGSPSQVFTIRCDEENNPPAEVNHGCLRVEVTFYPTDPAETVRIVVIQHPTGGFAAEV